MTLMFQADLRLLSGGQGSGKTESMVGFAADDYVAHTEKLITKNGEYVRARSLNKDEKLELIRCGLKYNPFKHFRIYSDDGTKSKIIAKPSDWMIWSPVRIFSNIPLYGMRYMFTTTKDFIEYINTDEISDGWYLRDESSEGDARESMTLEGRLNAWGGAQIRKSGLHFLVAAQMNTQIELRYRAFQNTLIMCDYDPIRCLITLEITEKGKPTYTKSYDGKMYRTFFKSDYKTKIPQYKIDKYLKMVNKSQRVAQELEVE